MPRPRASAWALALLAPALTLGAAAVLRFLDGDEGDYALASVLVYDGDVLYRDFLYTQTPLLPYVYGAWAELVGERWHAMRLLSVAFSVALAALLYADVRARVGPRIGAGAVAVFAGASLVFVWYPTLKTYALSTLLLFAAYVLLERARPSRRLLAGAGALAALSVETRSLLLGGAVVLAWAAYRSGRTRGLAAFGAGFAVALLPTLVFLALDAERFLYGNLWYHGERSAGGLVGDLGQKVATVATLLGIPNEARPIPQYLLLVLAAVAAALAVRSVTRRVPLALLVAAGLSAVALLPTPTYTQYFATTVPFLVAGIAQAVPLARVSRSLALRSTVAAGAIGLYALFGAMDFYRAITPSQENRPGALQEVADVIDENTNDGDVVISGFTGYLFGTDARPWPGLENAFAPHAAAAVGPEDARRMQLATAAELERAIRARRVRVVVARVWHDLPPIPSYETAARDAGYRLVSDLHAVPIYALP